METNVSYCGVVDTFTPAVIYSSSPLSSDELIRWTDPPENATFVKGFFTGCNAFESLLQSTLDCLYEIGCLQLLNDHFPFVNQVYFILFYICIIFLI